MDDRVAFESLMERFNKSGAKINDGVQRVSCDEMRLAERVNEVVGDFSLDHHKFAIYTLSLMGFKIPPLERSE